MKMGKEQESANGPDERKEHVRLRVPNIALIADKIVGRASGDDRHPPCKTIVRPPARPAEDDGDDEQQREMGSARAFHAGVAKVTILQWVCLSAERPFPPGSCQSDADWIIRNVIPFLSEGIGAAQHPCGQCRLRTSGIPRIDLRFDAFAVTK